jgi:hypothetical protein
MTATAPVTGLSAAPASSHGPPPRGELDGPRDLLAWLVDAGPTRLRKFAVSPQHAELWLGWIAQLAIAGNVNVTGGMVIVADAPRDASPSPSGAARTCRP